MTRKNVHILALGAWLIQIFVLASCAHVYTKEFLLSDETKDVSIMGWKIEPNIFAYRNVGGSEQPPIDGFIVKIKAWHPRVDINTDIYDVELDTVHIVYPSESDTISILMNHKGWPSISSAKNIHVYFSWLTEEYSANFLKIPDSIDSIDIVFNATVALGTLTTQKKSRSDLEYDDIFVEDNAQREIIPVRMKLYRHQTEHPYPAFLIDRY